MKIKLLPLFILSALLASLAPVYARKSPARHWVRTYTRKDGTVVQGHWAGSGSRTEKSTGSTPPSTPDTPSTPPSNPSDPGPLTYNYPQEPTLEPSWVRQQRREKAEQAARDAAIRAAKNPPRTAKVAPGKKPARKGR